MDSDDEEGTNPSQRKVTKYINHDGFDVQEEEEDESIKFRKYGGQAVNANRKDSNGSD